MFNLDPTRILDEVVKDDWGSGSLTLCIVCCNCEAQYVLNKESVAVAIMSNASFIDYLKWIQSSECVKCTGEDQ